MKIGDLIRNRFHMWAGIGIVVDVGGPAEAPDYVIAVWPDYGEEIAYADEIEVISESR